MSISSSQPVPASRPEIHVPPLTAGRRRFRSAIRIVLAFTFAAGAFAAYRFSRPASPEQLRAAAEQATQAARWEEAQVHLRKLAQRTSLDASERLALAESFLQQARRTDPDATYATDRVAFEHLGLACEAAPRDRALQQQFMTAAAARGDYASSRIAAERILDVDSADPVALLARFASTLELDPASVDERLDETFRLLVLERSATDSPLDDTTVLVRDRLLRAAVRRAPEATTARERLVRLLDGYERLFAAPEAPRVQIARDVSRLMAVAGELAKSPASTPESLREWAEVDRRAERLRAAAITAGPCDRDVYFQSAAAAFAQGAPQAGLELVAAGLQVEEQADDSAVVPAAPLGAFAWHDESGERRTLADLHRLAAYQLIELRRYAAAEPHLEALRDLPDSAGSAALLAGWSALTQGKSEIARREFHQARELLGEVAPAHMGLAGVEMLEQHWKSANEHLTVVHDRFELLTPEDRAWSLRFFGEGQHGLTLCRLYAELKLGNWPTALSLADSLGGTKWEPRAEAVIIADFWSNNARTQALERLADARCRFPLDFGLMAVDWMILCRQQRTDDARRCVEQFAAAIPAADLETQLLLCGWRVRNLQAEEAWRQLSTLPPQADPASARAVALLQVETLLALGRVDEALQVAAPLRQDPRAALVAGVLSAVAETRRDRPDQAAQALRTAADLRPESVVLNHLRGEFAVRARDWHKAWEHLARSLDVHQLRGKAGRLLAYAARERAKQEPIDEVLTQLTELLARVPDDPHVRIAQADLLLKRGRLDEAIELLRQVEHDTAGDRELTALIAETWWQAGKPQFASAVIVRGLQLFQPDAPCLLIAAKSSLSLRRPDHALEYAIAAQNADPRAVTAPLLRAEALHQLRRRFEAIVLLQRAVRQFPDSAEVHLALGRMFERSDRADDALAAYRFGQEATPQDVTLRRAEIALLLNLGRTAEANQTAQRLASDAPSSDLCLALGEAFAGARQYDQAEAWFRRALHDADAKHVSAAHLLLGMSLAQQRQSQRSAAATNSTEFAPEQLAAMRDHFSAAWEAEPRNLVAANNLAWTLAHDFGRADEAACVLDVARGDASVSQWPTTFVHTCAVVYRAAGRDEDARRALEQALRYRPEQSKLWLEQGLLSLDAERIADAHTAFHAALELGLSEVDARRAREALARLDPH